MKAKILILLLVAVDFAVLQKNWSRDVYVPNICVCGTLGDCEIAATGGISDGSGLISPRIVASGNVDNYFSGTVEELCEPVFTGLPIAAESQAACNRSMELSRCCPRVGYTCGIRYPPVSAGPKPIPGSGQIEYGAYPWHAMIVGPNNSFISSGVLIDQKHVLTVAHRIFRLNTTTVEVRLGVHNRLDNSSDPFPTLIFNATFVIHPQFTFKNLKYNIAVLTLSDVVPLGKFPTIANICLPNTTVSDVTCFVSGWGFPDANTKTVQAIMMDTDVPMVDRQTCQNQLIATKLLSSTFQLDGKHFICAGGNLKKDACFGDGGAPLSCRIYDRFYLFGLVAWGLGCGNASVPGVYTNVLSFIPWIRETIYAESPTTPMPSTLMGVRATTTPSGRSTTRAGATNTTRVAAGLNTTRRASTVRQGAATARTTVRSLRSTVRRGRTTTRVTSTRARTTTRRRIMRIGLPEME